MVQTDDWREEMMQSSHYLQDALNRHNAAIELRSSPGDSIESWRSLQLAFQEFKNCWERRPPQS